MPPSCARARACVSTSVSRRSRPPRTPREARRNANRFRRWRRFRFRFRRRRRRGRRPPRRRRSATRALRLYVRAIWTRRAFFRRPRAASRAQPRGAVALSPRAAHTPNAERASPPRRAFVFVSQRRLPTSPGPVRSSLDEARSLRARRSHRRRRSRFVVRRAPASATNRSRPRGVSAEPPRPAPGAGPACAARGGTRCRAARARRGGRARRSRVDRAHAASASRTASGARRRGRARFGAPRRDPRRDAPRRPSVEPSRNNDSLVSFLVRAGQRLKVLTRDVARRIARVVEAPVCVRCARGIVRTRATRPAQHWTHCAAGPFASSVGVGRAEPEWAALNKVTGVCGEGTRA